MAKRVLGISDSTAHEDVSPETREATITAITQANPAVVTAASHGFSDGDIVQIDGVVGMTEVNDGTYTVASATTNTFALTGINSSAYTAYSSAGTATKVGDGTNFPNYTAHTVEVHYDTSTSVDKIVDALKRASEKITELMS